MKKLKLIRVADLRDVMDKYNRGEITFSRAAEMLNDAAIAALISPMS